MFGRGDGIDARGNSPSHPQSQSSQLTKHSETTSRITSNKPAAENSVSNKVHPFVKVFPPVFALCTEPNLVCVPLGTLARHLYFFQIHPRYLGSPFLSLFLSLLLSHFSERSSSRNFVLPVLQPTATLTTAATTTFVELPSVPAIVDNRFSGAGHTWQHMFAFSKTSREVSENKLNWYCQPIVGRYRLLSLSLFCRTPNAQQINQTTPDPHSDTAQMA